MTSVHRRDIRATGTGGTKGGRAAGRANHFEVPFEDNRRLGALLGEYDSNLALIEDRLGIMAIAHGNIVTLTGSKSACATARSVLELLYARIIDGENIGAGDVEGAIRHAALAGDACDNGMMDADDVSPGRSNADDAGTPTMAQIRTRKRTITARTPMQSRYVRALASSSLLFAAGPAGTGKTYLAVAYAAQCLEHGLAERLVLSRPAVEAGERLGFLPGDMREKVDPYLRPLYDALYDVLPPEKVERGLDTGMIEIAPLAFMRGRTLAHAMIILDEAQNCTAMQMKMFLTRIGDNSKMVVTGDPSQIDLPPGQTSGLADAMALLDGIDGIESIRFTREDVVRRALVARIVGAYNRIEEKKK